MMSRERALKAINLQPTDRIPLRERINNPHFITKITGMDPYKDPQAVVAEAYRKLDIDVVISLPTKASILKQFETRYDEEGTIGVGYWGLTETSTQVKFPFSKVEDILVYDPFKIKPQSVSELTQIYKEYLQEIRTALKSSALVVPMYHTTLFMWPVTVFGWEMFMTAAALEPEAFKQVLDKFALLSIRHTKALSKTDAPAIICHDDIAMNNDPVFSPDWYERYIFPWYKEIFKPLKKAGKKVIFCSDGKLDPLIDSLIATGVDGFMIDSAANLAKFVKKCGQNKVIIGGINTNVLVFGSPQDVQQEVERCTNIAKDSPGYFYMIGGDVPKHL